MKIFNTGKAFMALIIVLVLFVSPDGYAVEKNADSDTVFVYLREFGFAKTRKKDCIPLINEALKNIDPQQPTKIVFPKGIFHFYPEESQKRDYFESNTTDANPRNCAFLFEGKNNLVIDGNGCMLIFHGQMQPFTFDNCSNVVLKNISIDWEQPLTAQGQVKKVTENYVELAVDMKQSPYAIDEGKLFFFGSGAQKEPWKSAMEFDREGRFIVPQTCDLGCLGNGWANYLAETTMPGIIRLNYPFSRKPKVGNYVVLRHSERIHSGIFIIESKNIRVENVNLYHATGLGILAQFSENLTFDGYRAIPNRAKNRYFGGGDDGLQISNCKGKIRVANCEFAGLMDDPINIHGTSVQVEEILSKRQIKCRFMHHQSVGLNWGRPGDKISFIENSVMQPLGTGEIVSFQKISNETFSVVFKNDIPAELQPKDALENLTWSPEVVVTGNRFKSCRARGLLVSTPGSVLIENNVFESSGSAILIAGDANRWFESGAVTDVTIRNNIFTELCNTSSYQFCEGIISIFPEIPVLNATTPPFHKNIRIENNEFYPFDYPVLFARSVNVISFTGNKLTRSTRFEPWHNRQYTFSFEACKNILVENNSYSGDILGRNILLKWTEKQELKQGESENLNVVESR